MAIRKCIDCGKTMLPPRRMADLCSDCAAEHIWDNARQLKEKKGPYYERWKAGVKAHAERLMKEDK